MMDTCQIISGNELRRLQRYKRFAWAGWVVAGLLVMILAAAVSRLESLERHVVELKKLKAEVLEIQEKQELVNASYIKAWKLQQETADALISWGEFSIEKKKIIESNKGAVSYSLLRRQNESPRSARNP